jgi:hypothetical protein
MGLAPIAAVMRSPLLLISVLLAAAPVARADRATSARPDGVVGAAPARAHPPIALSRILDGGKQALVYDGLRGEYAVLKAGDVLHGYRVVAVERAALVIEGGSPAQRLTLGSARAVADSAAAPAPDAATSAAPPAAAPAASPASEVIDPYAPYAAEPAPTAAAAPVPSPLDPGTAPAPVPAAAPAADLAPAPAPAPAPAATAAPAAAPAPTIGNIADSARKAPRVRTVKVRRAEVDAALADFARLSREVEVELTGSGVAVTRLERDSLLARLGLETGDVVTSVSGHRLTSLDAAAEAYVALLGARRLDVALVRGGAPMVLRVLIR